MTGASSYANVGDLRLHYLDWPGGDPPVLCLPGITANAHAFAGLAEELSPAHRVLAMDLRGRGASDKPADGYNVPTHAADAAGLLRELAIGQAVVIGWSLGGRVALALAALHPAVVDRLVLIDPPVATSAAAATALRAFWARLDNTYDSVEAFLARMRDHWRFTEWTVHVERYLRADVDVGSGGVVRHRIPRHVPEADLEAEHLFPTRSFYDRVRCPVLIIRSCRPLVYEGDQVLTADDAEEMAASLAHARLVEVADENHFSILLGTPRSTLGAVRAFLSETARSPAGRDAAASDGGPAGSVVTDA